MSYQFPSSGGRSASVSSASASQSTHATPVNVSLTAGDRARIAISTTCLHYIAFSEPAIARTRLVSLVSSKIAESGHAVTNFG